jgi:hypothetical protein
MKKLWEVGSEFDWSDEFLISEKSQNVVFIPEFHELFSTGTSVLLSLQRLLNVGKNKLRLHLPSFFCMDIVPRLKEVFEIAWYRDLPTEGAPDFNSLHPLPGDLVLAVNFFGIRQGKVWQDWLSQHDDIILIEDHTHDPFSVWAQQSTAHYAMASLRKTLPLPDGAIVWSPQKMPLPKPASPPPYGAYQKLSAMLLKRAYISGMEISKDAYRQLQIEGEEQLYTEIDSAASSFTTNILKSLDIPRLRQHRERNISRFLKLILAEEILDIVPLFSDWDLGAVPFNSILICKTPEIRERLRKFLINQNIFVAVHWEQNLGNLSANDTLAIHLSNCLLTIPTDFRYSLEDVERVTAKVLNFFQIDRLSAKLKATANHTA